MDPGWILKALAATLGLGLLCSYVMLCLFFYTGQWNLVLHPSRTVLQTPAKLHLPFEAVRFGDDTTGTPQIAGWWVPAASPGHATALLLHDGKGSMADTLPVVEALHGAELNVLDFDYRGFGTSARHHPTERLMDADAQKALTYLLTARKVNQNNVLIVGAGLGASVAVGLCEKHTDLRGLVLVDADGDTASRVLADQRSHIVPVSLLFHERFALADPLHTLATPKLIVSYTQGNAPEFAQRAADPKMTTELPPGSPPAALGAAIRTFLDSSLYAPASPPGTKDELR